MLGDQNVRVGDAVVVCIIRRHWVPGINKSGEKFLKLCAERER